MKAQLRKGSAALTLATFNVNNLFLRYKFAVAAADINLGYIPEKSKSSPITVLTAV